MNTIARKTLGALMGLALAGVTPVLAQKQPTTYRACFMPQAGAMYLIGLPGLPADCLSDDHEEISWSEGGGEGDNGTVADGSISTAKLADGAVSSAKLADGAVTSAKLANNAVGSDQVLDNSLTSIDLATNSVTRFELATGSVGEDELLANSVGALEIQTGAVRSSEILDGSITADDLSEDAVGLDIEQVTSSVTIPEGLSLAVAVP